MNRKHETVSSRRSSRHNRKSKNNVPPRMEALEGRIFQTVTPDPGSTFNTAYNIGPLQGGNSFGDHIGTADPVDTYAFDAIAPGTVYFRLRPYQNDAYVALTKDTFANGTHTYTFQGGGVVSTNDSNSGNFFADVAPGHYYVTVVEQGADTDYLLRVTADYAGSTPATARNIGNLTGSGLTTYTDEVGANFVIDPFTTQDVYHDPLDVYKFTLTQPADVSEDVTLGAGFTANQFFQVHAAIYADSNHDGVLSNNEILGSSGAGAQDEQIPAVHLNPGTYFVQVDSNNTAYPNYVLSINVDQVGYTFATAKNLGTIFGQQQIRESVSEQDGNDYYKFTLDQPGEFKAALTGLSDEVGLQIDNGNGTPIQFTNNAGAGDRSLDLFLNKGTYYVVAYDATVGFGSNYTLTLTADYAGNGFGVPRNIGALGATPQLFNDYLDKVDRYDYYQFTIGSSNQPFEASIGDSYTSGFVPDLNPTLYLNKFNPADGSFSPIAQANNAGSSNILLANLRAGTYQLVAAEGNFGAGNYSLYLQAPPDLAGNDLPTAKNLGSIAGHSSFSDFVGTGDTVDTFKFTFATAGTFDTSLFPGVSSVYLQLVQDKNNNGVFDSNELVAGSFNAGNAATQKIHTNLAAGTYFLRVRYNSGPILTPYQLTLDANFAGTTLPTARNFGTLSTTPVSFSDEVDQFSNPSDFYKFNLTTAGTLSAKLTYTTGENTVLSLIQDKNNNGKIDAGEILATTADTGTGLATITKALGAGTYFLRVTSTNGGGNYTLSVHR